MKKKNVRSKFNFKFSNLLHMSKGCIFIGNLMNNVSIVLGYDHVNFRCFTVLINYSCVMVRFLWPEVQLAHRVWEPVTMETAVVSMVTDRRTTDIIVYVINTISTDSFVCYIFGQCKLSDY